VEVFPPAAEEAKTNLNSVYVGDIETIELPIEKETIDVILCLDVLEHLVDPWSVMQRLTTLLRPGGAIIASIPNVRNVHVVIPLLLFGKWDYTQDNYLDKTHLRFFTKRTAIALMECSGLTLDMLCSTGFEESWNNARIANALTFGLLQGIFERGYLLRARKPVYNKRGAASPSISARGG